MEYKTVASILFLFSALLISLVLSEISFLTSHTKSHLPNIEGLTVKNSTKTKSPAITPRPLPVSTTPQGTIPNTMQMNPVVAYDTAVDQGIDAVIGTNLFQDVYNYIENKKMSSNYQKMTPSQKESFDNYVQFILTVISRANPMSELGMFCELSIAAADIMKNRPEKAKEMNDAYMVAQEGYNACKKAITIKMEMENSIRFTSSLGGTNDMEKFKEYYESYEKITKTIKDAFDKFNTILPISEISKYSIDTPQKLMEYNNSIVMEQLPMQPPMQVPMVTPIQLPTISPMQPPMVTPIQLPTITPMQPPMVTPMQPPMQRSMITPMQLPMQRPMQNTTKGI